MSETVPHDALDGDGVWAETLRLPSGKEIRPALFLDRDGVIVVEADYLHRIEDVSLIPGAAETVKKANQRGLLVVIITNQAGIGYGYYGWNDFIDVQKTILEKLSAAGAAIDGVFACPFHPKGKPPFNIIDHPARKPNPGMILKATTMLPIDLARSWIVGDRKTDLLAGKNAGLAGGMHVSTGHGNKAEQQSALSLDCESFKVVTGASIANVPDMVPLFIPG